MKVLKFNDPAVASVVRDLEQHSFLKEMGESDVGVVFKSARLLQYDPSEPVIETGGEAKSFFLLAKGEVVIKVRHERKDELIEIMRVKPFDLLGEMGLLLGETRSATAVASVESILIEFSTEAFNHMFKTMPAFAMAMCRLLAQRLKQTSAHAAVPSAETVTPDPAVRSLLPLEFIMRQRVLPIRTEGSILHLGFVEPPTPRVISMVRDLVPGMEIRPMPIGQATYAAAMQTASGVDALKEDPAAKAAPPAPPEPSRAPALDQLLRRMVAEGASDVHLSAGERPRWRIDGEMRTMTDTKVLGPDEVLELAGPILPDRSREQFKEVNDADFAHAIPDVARFRVNLFRETRGVSAVFRQIPCKILTIEQLGLPPVVRALCDYPKGLVLVTGPTGSGKSTSLAAMIDYLNKTRDGHIITLEDPIEFVHLSQHSLINQREIGAHATTFARALRAALREDPDIVLVGEMRDLETVALALETANTGHLVFGTLHTNTAVSAVSRVTAMFPSEQQTMIRAVLAENLRGVICQTLCRKIGGGRIAALEIMVVTSGIANLIREGQTHQVVSYMQAGKAQGNKLLNDDLTRLVKENLITTDEAMSKAVEKAALAKTLGVPVPVQ